MGTAKDQIFDAMDVLDLDGDHVGKVVRYDVKLGYFETKGTFGGSRYVPFTAIERIGADGVRLNVTRSYVANVYEHSPAVTPTFTPEGRLGKQATIPSGWTGRPVPLDAAAINELKEKITIGSAVYDADNRKLGKIDAYDAKSGYMRIEKAGLSSKDVFLPVTTVGYLDDRGVHLAETKETIATRFSRLPEIAKESFAI
jgi:hypothetical protein